MSGKVEKFLETLIVILILYLLYGMYEPQIHKLTAEIRKSVQQTEQQETALAEAPDTEGTLPAAYDNRETGKAPAVKNQGNLGTCWALAATSALEANLRPDEIWDFSADHMSMQNGYDKNQNDGGAYTMAMSYLASWTGPVREEDDVYGDGYSPDNLSPVKHVQEMHMIKDGTLDEIKREIYRYGAVQSSVYVDTQGSLEGSVYYSQLNNSYCYTGDEPANHDILIIGWDDYYAAENFTYQVRNDGAFICQNSWGSRFGEDGIFYVSYEDALITDCCVSYAAVEDTDNYANIYQTDLCGWVGQLGYNSSECYFANVYTPQGTESLEAVGFYATGPNTTYEIYVAAQFEDTSSLVVWEPAATGRFDLAGYYTVTLPEPVVLTAGQPFAVIVKIRTPDTLYPVAAEYQADENTAGVIISDGEGYISQTGYVWTRAEESYGCNVCLKAYTS
ncbi:MAG: lectin like domain-containing protein [Eubacteriales bacterium]|nr:lectin like domain-containing protein [Eubacteriales bacterium]